MAQQVSPETTQIGWVGAGVMGCSMCGHLLDAGYKVCVHSRTLAKCKTLQDKGASVVSTPSEVGQNADCVFLIVGYPRDVRSVVLGENGVLKTMKPGSVLVDMTTSEPTLAREIYVAAQQKGVLSLDAPVSGGDVGAREARLSIMIGGDRTAFDMVSPLLAVLGKNIRFMGGPGMGQHTKMTNQILIASGMIGLVEGLLYAHKAGLDLETTLAVVGAGAAGSWSLANYAPRIIKRNFDPGFFVDHFVKDMGIALEESRRMGLALPGLALANQLYIALQAQGHGQKGTHALALALETLNNTKIA